MSRFSRGINCFGSYSPAGTGATSATAETADEYRRRPNPKYKPFFSEWGSFAYAFVDKYGERRPIPTVASVDLRHRENGRAHRTERFELNRLGGNQVVVRRGQQLHITIKFENDFNAEIDAIMLAFQVGKEPKISKGTEILVPVAVDRLERRDYWAAALTAAKRGRNIPVTIITPPDCIVGIWSMEIRTIRKEDLRPNIPSQPLMNRYSCHNVYILFNPWCRDDQVYMENETWRNEYVLNDVGKIWRGVASNFRPCVWSFGQFEHNVLDASMILLDYAKMSMSHRGSPVYVSRTVSAMVNANDDQGVLVGNWSGDYEDATPPTDWQGSVQILQQWHDNAGAPVRYGQCWVFSGVTTTVLRALGIPARSVTNFASAHDTDTSITIDLHFNEKGKHVKELDRDSVWNFHVWNDCWMMRPDLPRGYGGWQAIDATPQEKSEGIFRAGPASLVAIRKGEVGFGYDTSFIFAEVNADKVYWLYQGPEKPLQYIDLDNESIGKFISTRKPGPMLAGNNDREDITDQYKQPEMSAEERMVVMNAMNRSQSRAKHIYQKQAENDVVCELELKDEVLLGKEFQVRVKVHNQSKEIRTVKTALRVDTMHYTGHLVKRVAKDLSEIILQAEEDRIVSVNVHPEQYLDKLLDQGSLMMSCLLQVKETGQLYHAEDDFRIKFPEIAVWVPTSGLVKNKPTKVYGSFLNPLNRKLTNAKFIFEGPGIENPTEIRIPDVGPLAKAEAYWDITPREGGDLTILVSFSSRELRDIDGYLLVQVREH